MLDPEAALDEIARVLRPGGAALLMVHTSLRGCGRASAWTASTRITPTPDRLSRWSGTVSGSIDAKPCGGILMWRLADAFLVEIYGGKSGGVERLYTGAEG